ncbi:hypothetical protein C2G38_2165803 [Gigaspora rosea]|uniref:Uncharacterized protein n=1 Tax=Gigaspora rosea TaxID=44941 RepID=A0A397VSE0_9GLOM|nr:hypothetical protein C2G38_2165803 [Gigaspora rosea]
MTQVKLSYSSDWAYIYDILLCSKALLHSKASKKLKDVMRSISTKLNHRYLLLPELEPEVMKVDPEIVKKIPTFELLKNLFDDIPYKMLGVNCISMTLFTVYYMTAQVEELMTQVESIDSAVQFSIPTLSSNTKYTSNIYDFFTNYEFLTNQIDPGPWTSLI